MTKRISTLYPLFLVLLMFMGITNRVHAGTVELRGKITQITGALPATAVLHSVADETFSVTALINKDSTFSFTVDVPKAGLYYLRIMRSSFDVFISTSEKVVNLAITFDADRLQDYQVLKSPENDAYKAFKTLVNLYDAKLITHFRNCDNEDSCEKVLHGILAEYAHELTNLRQNFKGTYTSEVLCPMKMPVVAKNVKNTSAEFRKEYFDKVNFADSTILATPIYKEMVAGYVEFIMEPSLSQESAFVTYFMDKIKANPAVLHKSAVFFYEDIFGSQREKMLQMFINWYNTGDHSTLVNSPVLESRIKSVSVVMPGQPFIDFSAPDTSGLGRSLKDVVGRSKCTLLIFWSSECSHCRDEMPHVKEYYEKYHSKGFDVYGASIEGDPVKWKNFINDKGLAWTNVLIDRKVSPNPAVEYVVTNTPSMVLIDNKGNILHRFITKSKLEERIKEALK